MRTMRTTLNLVTVPLYFKGDLTMESYRSHCHQMKDCVKEARGSFFVLRVEVLKLQSRIQDKLRSPSHYFIISTYDQS